MTVAQVSGSTVAAIQGADLPSNGFIKASLAIVAHAPLVAVKESVHP